MRWIKITTTKTYENLCEAYYQLRSKYSDITFMCNETKQKIVKLEKENNDFKIRIQKLEQNTKICNFCQNTGYHYSPESVQPIIVTCKKKRCVYGKLAEQDKILLTVSTALKDLLDCSGCCETNSKWAWAKEALDRLRKFKSQQ